MTTPTVSPRAARILVTGATGFVGSRVLSALRARGKDVIGGTRNPNEASASEPGVSFCHVDLDDPVSLASALIDVDQAVYLVHGMSDSGSYVDAERRYAENFRDAAENAKLGRIVYLGGIPPQGEPSRHLDSRLHTGEILRAGKIPVVELQATMIVGGGSESFRIVRDLSARLPGMLLPKWLDSKSEPVAIDDVVAAILHSLAMPLTESEVLTAPGPELLSGTEIIKRTARAMGHRPIMLSVPFVTPHLSSYWIRLVTRANPQVATELVEGLRHNIVANGKTIWQTMPEFRRTSFDEAVHRALRDEERALPIGSLFVERLLHLVTRSPRPRST
jgi:uncharacterized protein YbjT (DUF2867 family)